MDWNNKREVLEAVKKWGGALEYASKELRNDKEVVLEAVKNWIWAFTYASEALRNNKEFMLMMAREDYKNAIFASQELQYHGDFMKIVNDICLIHHFKSKELCNDKEVVLEAMRKDIRAFQYASKELRNDKEVVLVAVRKDPWTLEYASLELIVDKDIIFEALKNYIQSTYYLPSYFEAHGIYEMKDDEELEYFADLFHISIIRLILRRLEVRKWHIQDKFSLLELIKEYRNGLE